MPHQGAEGHSIVRRKHRDLSAEGRIYTAGFYTFRIAQKRATGNQFTKPLKRTELSILTCAKCARSLSRFVLLEIHDPPRAFTGRTLKRLRECRIYLVLVAGAEKLRR